MTAVQVDFDKVKQAATLMRASAPTEEQVKSDPKAFLAQYGVDISDDLNAMIKERLSGAGATAQASAVHIDV